MKIVVQNTELDFGKIPELSTDDSTVMYTDEWSATVLYNDYELDFEFDESSFKEKDSSVVKIDWVLIEEFVEHILENIESIQEKGSFVLEELHRQIFGEDNLNKNKGYFEVAGIKLEDYRKVERKYGFEKSYFKYQIIYLLDSEKGYLMDPYHSYTAKFSSHNGLTIIGVSREG